MSCVFSHFLHLQYFFPHKIEENTYLIQVDNTIIFFQGSKYQCGGPHPDSQPI